MSNYSFDKDLEQMMTKTWTIEHNGYKISVRNETHSELLYINDELVVENHRTQPLSYIKPYQTLRYTYDGPYGMRDNIHVKLGGIIALRIKVKVNGEVIFKDKVSFFK